MLEVGVILDIVYKHITTSRRVLGCDLQLNRTGEVSLILFFEDLVLEFG
jgi:hypothetical protein